MSYKLDKINRTILYELDKNCRVSDNKLAKKVNRSRESVRNRIIKLEKDEIIQGFITSLNPSKFGYMFFKMYFKLANIPKEREKFYNYFKTLPGLYWFAENDGAWDFHTTMYAKNIKEFNNLKNKIYTDFKNLIIKRDTGVLVNVRQYPKKYLIENETSDEHTLFGDEIINNELTPLEKELITILSQNARISIVELAKKTNSSIDIIRNKMKKLEQQGIIIQYRIAINHTKLGYELFKALLYFENISEEDEHKLNEFCRKRKEINYIVRQFSAWDIELEIMVKNYEEFINIMNEIRLKFPTLKNYESLLMREDLWVFGQTK
ncbi:MAG: Lrp/AsnC family transcriptional regulator [Nanoarchaeota archaeon]|nr:Lrp/AsnC family transcriptional regulator [Nanoarchaeota archaeon]MBU1855061.1 Lrp/AsnC family transcriptional regulator [Nanoarchaeota archaeon]